MSDRGFAGWTKPTSKPTSKPLDGLPLRQDETDPTEQIRKAIRFDLAWIVALSEAPINRLSEDLVERLLKNARERVLELAADLDAYHGERN
ncbi:MAG: hypothetical protein WCO96_01275 [Actinomycetes bacterium]|jgi:hypothetical protein